jgi:hypothetical protein
MGLITAPLFGVDLRRDFGHLSIDLRFFVDGYIVTKSSFQASGTNDPLGGGDAAPRADVGGVAAAEYRIPRFESLAVGIDFYTAYTWYYDITANSAPGPVTGCQTSYSPGTGGQYPNAHFGFPCQQPAQQAYGGEIFVRYSPPVYKGIHTDITLAFAQGDPTLGYTSILHDGVQHLYGFWRLTSEFYGALGVRY